MKFLSHQRAQSPLLPKAALWLMNHRSQGWWWSTTKQTAMVIYGLTDYLKATNELNPNLTATVFVNDQPVLTKKFDSRTRSRSRPRLARATSTRWSRCGWRKSRRACRSCWGETPPSRNWRMRGPLRISEDPRMDPRRTARGGQARSHAGDSPNQTPVRVVDTCMSRGYSSYRRRGVRR